MPAPLNGRPAPCRPSAMVACHECGTGFKIKPSRIAPANFCKRACYAKHRTGRPRAGMAAPSPRVTRKCPVCGVAVTVLASKARQSKASTCSPEHLIEYMRRVPRPHTKPIGSTKTVAKGYVMEKTARGWVMQHRVQMERVLGRPLTKDENVHHINGVKDDNRVENLELWTSMQPSGQRVADLLAFAHEVIARYGSLDSLGAANAAL